MDTRRAKTWNSNRGMTLIELLLVMAILSVVMMAVISLYVPAHQSTVTQTQVSDVNSNLRLALNTMTRDLLIAGFLEPRFPVVFPDADPDFTDETLNDMGTENTADFIIRTRIVGDHFARITSASNSASILEATVADADMVDNFPVGAKLRIFGSMNGEELIETVKSGVSSANRVLTVDSISGTTINVDVSGAGLSLAEMGTLASISDEAVMVRVKDTAQPAMQTIRYQLLDGALARTINGSTQYLARNLDAVEFGYEYNAQGRVNRVDAKLTGKTTSQDKVREAETSVRLRNIN